jgi:hypothetical protein
MDERFSMYFALDGPHLDGLIGSAGLLRFDWPEKKFYVKYYDGISSGHNPSLAPNGKLALLGNFSQTIMLIDISDGNNMREVGRQSTMFFEECTYRLRANTHHLWYPDSERFIGAIGDHLYRFHVDDLKHPENLGPHRLENAHELRWDPTNRYILIGDLGPERRDVRQVGVFDLEEPDPEKRARVIKVQNNVWHCRVHPHKPVGYALTYSLITDNDDWVNWSPGYIREYIYEIDLPTAKITRTWSGAAEFPAHLNSDVEISEDDNLYIASGGNHSVVEIPLDRFAESRVLECNPRFSTRALAIRDKIHSLVGAFSRKAFPSSSHYVLQTWQVTGGRVLDGIYAARVSPDGQYLVVGNRGYNVVAVYDRKTFKKVYEKLLPFRRDNYSGFDHYQLTNRFLGHHLGVHHSELIPRDGITH